MEYHPKTVMPGVEMKMLDYKEYRETSQNCDIILHTPTTYAGRAIARHTGGVGYDFSHVEAVVWWFDVDRLMSCGYQEGSGGVARPLSSFDFSQNSVHVFRIKKEVWKGGLRHIVIKHLAGDLGKKYGWWVIALQLLALLPLVRLVLPRKWFLKTVNKLSESSGYGICSQHVARSFGSVGIEFIKGDVAMVTPNDIAKSYVTEYVGTLQ